ncbi:MAG: porin [Hydrogenothermus sp.]|nr:MAG: porin [Hydrogenothermus sp.]
MVQVWNIYTLKNDPSNPDMDSRDDIYIRRGRIGVKGKLRKDISFKVWFAYDNLGKDKQTAATGGTSQDTYDNREFYIWDAIWTWHLDPEWANISIGYFRPQVGKESITTAFKVISFQKATTNFQPRRHIVYRGPGRETGINIGGLAINKKFNYNIGLFDTSEYTGNSGDKNWSPLIAMRFAWSFGDPEHKKYKMGYTQTYYGKRNGITLGLNYTYQGKTDYFKSNSLVGFDILANFGPIDFNAEYDILSRKDFNTNGDDYNNKVYSIKFGYNIKTSKGIIRPAVMYAKHDADSIFKTNPTANRVHSSLKTEEELYEVSLNWLINKDKLKLNIAYDWGKKDDLTKTTDKTNWSYIGVGFQFIY